MKCRNCGQEIEKKDFNGIYYHVKTKKVECEKKAVAVPELKDIGTVVCEDNAQCLHGAGCSLSSFPTKNKKKDPVILLENGVFYCKTWKKG